MAILAGGTWWYSKMQATFSQSKPKVIKPTPVVASESKPEVAGASFGDLLNQQRSYVGWIAGITDGSIAVMNPQSGEINMLTQAEGQWFGPISTLAWSPDRTKVAYLILPNEVAQGFNANPQAQAQKMGLDAVPSPQTFPFGRAVILDINTKQLQPTNMEVRNTPKSIIWLDDNRIAAITTSLSIYNLTEHQATAVTGAGITDTESQLQSPLVWDQTSETIYFTKVKKNGGQGARVAVRVSLRDNAVKELTMLRAGKYEDVSASRSIGMALDSAADRLAFVGQNGMAYFSLSDGGMYTLPPQDDWLWLKDSIISNVEWLSPSRIAFVSMATDGTKVWVVWDIPQAKLQTFGRGSDAGSWDKASGRLALVQAKTRKVNILTPNWQDPLQSTLEALDLPWQSLNW